jgi:NTE family protein
MSKTVALVLGSGGARGMAHIGVIQEIEARGYKVVSVSGCSIGAVVGAFYSANKLDVFYEWAKSLNYLNVLRLVDFSFISNGAIRGDKLFSVLSEMLGDIQIEDLEIPYTAVATDLISSKEVWFQRGSLEQAMRASAAIPGLIQPVEYEGRLYVDGGVLNPLPIAASVSVHADYIIAVDLSADVPVPVIKDAKQLAAEAEAQAKEKAEFDQAAMLEVEHQEQTQHQLASESIEAAEESGVDANSGAHSGADANAISGDEASANAQMNVDAGTDSEKESADNSSSSSSSDSAVADIKGKITSKLKHITPDAVAPNLWLNNMVNKASDWFSQDETEGGEAAKAKTEISGSKLGKIGILYQMFEVMQTSLSQYKIAGYPPDLLVKIPKDCVEMYEFYRANEMIEMGRYIAKEALDAFEQGHSSLYGQR